MGRKILPSSPHFHSRAGIWLERIKKNGDRDEGDPGQGCLSQIPGNPSLLPAFLGWNWADVEQEMPLGGSLRNWGVGNSPAGVPREGGIPWMGLVGIFSFLCAIKWIQELFMEEEKNVFNCFFSAPVGDVPEFPVGWGQIQPLLPFQSGNFMDPIPALPFQSGFV